MKSHSLMIRLLSEAGGFSRTVAVQTKDGLAPIESITAVTANVPYIGDDMQGPFSHNEALLVIKLGPVTKQRVEIRR